MESKSISGSLSFLPIPADWFHTLLMIITLMLKMMMRIFVDDKDDVNDNDDHDPHDHHHDHH